MEETSIQEPYCITISAGGGKESGGGRGKQGRGKGGSGGGVRKGLAFFTSTVTEMK